MKLWGWILLISGGALAIISDYIGSDWPFYVAIMVASSGATMIMCSNRHTRKQQDVKNSQ